MPVLQCGFIASSPAQGVEPGCSKDISSCTPVEVGAGAQTLSVLYTGGWGFGLAASADGKLYSWGVNQPTLLAKSGGDEGADPSTLDEVASGVASASGGFDHCLVVLREGGQLAAVGPAFRGGGGLLLAPIAFPVPVAQVAAGEHHSLVLTQGGDVYAFGSNREGQLGAGTAEASTTPLLVAGPGSSGSDAALRQPFTAIAAGARHSLALTSAGQCAAWGWSLHGQCGTGVSVPSISTPQLVAALGPLECVSIAGGMGHTVVCTRGGDVLAWGLNTDGQLGNGNDMSSLQPQSVEDAALAAEEVVKVAAGARHTLALTASGRAFAWGFGQFGQLGGGAFARARSPQLVQVPAGATVADIAAGWWHTLLLTA